MQSSNKRQQHTGNNSVRKILEIGVFKRILAIEMILLVWSLAWRAYSQGPDIDELFWFAIRIIILVAIIIAFVTLSLRRFLVRKIIAPLEAIARANLEVDTSAPEVKPVQLAPDTPEEIVQIAETRQMMLEKILKVSTERLHLVNFIRETFGRYLSQKVVAEILASPEGRKIGGRRTAVTILMADLRGFTHLAESLDPELTVNLLNRFFDKMARIIYARDGMIDEFLGDGILAIFGVPEKHPDDPARAVTCALEMQNALHSFNSEIASEGYPALEMGIGINTGSVIVGNIGSEIRSKYGIVGTAVNIASRIESLTTAGEVFVSQSTYEALEDKVQAGRPQTQMMKGLTSPLVFYPVKAIGPPYNVNLIKIKSNQRAVSLKLPFTLWRLSGKQIREPAYSGETTSVSQNELFVSLQRKLPPRTNVKLQLDFCQQAHCFQPIYAKVIAPPENAEGHFQVLRITAIDQEDRRILQQWMAEAD